MPVPCFLHVNSHPMIISPPYGSQWYTTEPLLDLISSDTSTRATLYSKIDSPTSTDPTNARKSLARHQTERLEPPKISDYSNLHTTSSLFAKEGGANSIQSNGDFDARKYELIQAYDPLKTGETPPPFMVTVETSPSDPADFEKRYREEHLDMLSKMPGYQKSLRYRLAPVTFSAKVRLSHFILLFTRLMAWMHLRVRR